MHTTPPSNVREKSDSGYVIEHYRRVQRAARGFDGVGYAMRLLRFLAPAKLTVAVRASSRDLQSERGRAWDRGADEHWATLAIPPSAGREEIAEAVLALTGRAGEPMLFETLMHLPEPD